MVVAGCPKSSKRHAKRACRMALEMKKVFAELRLEMYQILGIRPSVLDIRIGLNSGPIVAGVVGVTNPRCALLLVKDMGCWLGATAAEAVHLLAWRLVWVVDTWRAAGGVFFPPLLVSLQVLVQFPLPWPLSAVSCLVPSRRVTVCVGGRAGVWTGWV